MKENEGDPKMVIVMRDDLNMRKGKMIAQGSHACLSLALKAAGNRGSAYWMMFNRWESRLGKKICVRVKSEEHLFNIYSKALLAGLPVHLQVDVGLTEFRGVPTATCCAIGPALPEDIDPITGCLSLL